MIPSLFGLVRIGKKMDQEDALSQGCIILIIPVQFQNHFHHLAIILWKTGLLCIYGEIQTAVYDATP